MSVPTTLFRALSEEEKVDFFCRCQKLLVEFHPSSHFLFTKENYEERKFFVLDFLHKYKGYAYMDDNVCVLYNHVKVEDPNNPVKVVKDHIYREPAANYNAISIDFVVFKQLRDCLSFVSAHNSPQIEYVLFVKNNEVKLYNKERLLSALRLPSFHLGI